MQRASQRIFSWTTVLVLFVIVATLILGSLYTYEKDREVENVSLENLRMVSWNLTRLASEASRFDREMALVVRGVGNADELMLRYDILWSRYDYLLNSVEARVTRHYLDNQERLAGLFAEFQALEPELRQRLQGDETDWTPVATAWEAQRQAIQQILTDNFVGDETVQLMAGVEASRGRLEKLRILILAALLVLLVYLVVVTLVVRRQSRTDRVTGLPNSNYLRTLRTVDPKTTVIACEIPEFRFVLSEYGDELAISLTRLFVQRLRQYLRPADRLIQMSRSEFVILLKPREDLSLPALLETLVNATRIDWRTSGSVLHISSVFGAEPGGGDACTDWIQRYQYAHRALAQAHLEQVPYYIHGEELRRRFREDRIIHCGLVALFNGESGPLQLSLVYQPIVRSDDPGQITGAEVLLRCREETLGDVPPNRIVDLCERVGLGRTFGIWLFRSIARETRSLYQESGFQGYLSININPAMLTQQLVEDVDTLLVQQGIPASCLCMEITEDNAALDFERVNQVIDRLHARGVSFALDDFGTGHSSLEYVRELKVDRLKIDRCFVEGIEHSEDKYRFLGSIIAMARQAYMKTVIEGVENEAQWALVCRLGSVLVQGCYTHCPVPITEFRALLGAAGGEELAPQCIRPATN